MVHYENYREWHWICSVAVKGCIILAMSFRAGEVATMGLQVQTR